MTRETITRIHVLITVVSSLQMNRSNNRKTEFTYNVLKIQNIHKTESFQRVAKLILNTWHYNKTDYFHELTINTI